MGSKVSRELLAKRWVHSHEEDTSSETVYRPAGFNFPRSRGRTGFDLKPDGGAALLGIGPTDRPTETSGTWVIDDDDQLTLYPASQGGTARVMKIVSADEDRLVVRK